MRLSERRRPSESVIAAGRAWTPDNPMVGSRLIRIPNDSRGFRGCHASFPTRRGEACFALRGSKHGTACGSMAKRITKRRRSTHPGAPGKTRCAWHRCGASLGAPPTAERSGVVGVLIRIPSNSQALTGRHASSPTGRGEACFALKGSKHGTRLRINCDSYEKIAGADCAEAVMMAALVSFLAGVGGHRLS